MDLWIIKEYVDLPQMATLPALDLDHPLPADQTVPSGVEGAFLALHQVFQDIWRPRSIVNAMVANVVDKWGLDSTEDRGHVIGLV